MPAAASASASALPIASIGDVPGIACAGNDDDGNDDDDGDGDGGLPA